MALPNSNITTTMVGQELGISTRNVGTLCRSTAINKWSKWKPVRYDKVVGITENDLRQVRAGMNIANFNSAEDLMAFYRSNPNYGWGYSGPRGDTVSPVEPYRIGDFRNYEHNANRFYSVFVPDRVFGMSVPRVQVGLNMSSYNDYILNWDILQFEDLHLGVIVIRSGVSTPPYSEVVSSETLASAPYIDVPILSPVLGQSYDVFVFICGSFDGQIQGPYWALEGGMRSVIYLRELTVILRADWRNELRDHLDWSLTITNHTNNSISLSNANVFARYGDNPEMHPQEIGEFLTDLGDPLVIPPSGFSTSGTMSGVLEEYDSRGGYMLFRNSSMSQANTRANINVVQ